MIWDVVCSPFHDGLNVVYPPCHPPISHLGGVNLTSLRATPGKVVGFQFLWNPFLSHALPTISHEGTQPRLVEGSLQGLHHATQDA